MTLAEFVKKIIDNGGSIGTNEIEAAGAIYKKLNDETWGWEFPDGSKGYFAWIRGAINNPNFMILEYK